MQTKVIPKRISCDINHPDYDPQCYKYSAYLDGQELPHCFYADSEKGEAHCFVIDENGDLIPDGDRPATQVFTGDVVINFVSEEAGK